MLKQAAAGSIGLAAGAVLVGCGGAAAGAVQAVNESAVAKTGPAPADVLNFALNLEYLEAEYYTYATTGAGIDTIHYSNDAFPTSGPVPFKTYGAIAAEIAKDEQNHVSFLKKNLGSAAVVRPPIDLVNSFNAAAQAAGISVAPNGFNPFSSELNFILGAFIFEDVGVTAYHGAAGFLASTPYLTAAAGIMGIEAYHAGAIRRIIAYTGGTAVSNANKISNLRASADKAAGGTGHETPLPANVAGDANAISFSRSVQEVLDIVYLNASKTPASKGGFFPSGLNGNIVTS